MVVNYDFRKDYYTVEEEEGVKIFEGWTTRIITNGENLPAIEGEGFDFIYQNVPTGVNF